MSKFAAFLTAAFLCSGVSQVQADGHEEGEMHHPDPAEMFEKMDLNGDGTVDHEEFMEFAATMPPPPMHDDGGMHDDGVMHDDGMGGGHDGMMDCGDLEHEIRERLEHEMHMRMEEHWQQEKEAHREHMHHEIQEMRGHAERMQEELRQHGEDVRREVEHIQAEIARMEDELQMMDEESSHEGGPGDMHHDDGGDHDDGTHQMHHDDNDSTEH